MINFSLVNVLCNNNNNNKFVYKDLEFEPFEINRKDWKEVYVKAMINKKMVQYNNDMPMLNREQAEQRYDNIANNSKGNLFTYYMVTVKKEIVGFISLYESDDISAVSFSYFVKQDKQGKGYGKKMLLAIIEKYQELKKNGKLPKVKYIEAIVHINNGPSNHIIGKHFKKILTTMMRGALANKYILEI
jgi:RimJ/RimL family protein N-acetyltransferase